MPRCGMGVWGLNRVEIVPGIDLLSRLLRGCGGEWRELVLDTGRSVVTKTRFLRFQRAVRNFHRLQFEACILKTR